MKRVVLVIGVCLAVVQSPAWAAALTPAEQAAAAQKAFSDAQALAGGASASAAAGLSGNAAANTVNGFNSTYYQYSNTAPEAALFQGGNGSTQAPALNKITSCANDPANPDKFLQQNCDAINLMAKNPSTRPQFQLTNDPMFAKTRAIEANSSTLAANALGFVDQNAIGAFTGCTTQNQTTPATQAIEVCHEGSTDSSQTCRIGRSVVVSANTNYQCDKTTNTYLPQTCDKTVNVVVTKTAPVSAVVTQALIASGIWTKSSTGFGSHASIRSRCNTTGRNLRDDGDYQPAVNYLCNSLGCYTDSPRAGDVLCPSIYKTVYSCPAGTTLTGSGTNSICIYPAVVTSSVGNGCAAQEAAAL